MVGIVEKMLPKIQILKNRGIFRYVELTFFQTFWNNSYIWEGPKTFIFDYTFIL